MSSVSDVGSFGADGSRLAPMTRRSVDWARQLARRALSFTPPDVQSAFELVSEQASEAMSSAPTDKELREWQVLAADLATALKPLDLDMSEQARLLAGKLRSFVGRVARAPKETLALRPTSRRVLEAVLALGGKDCTLLAVRLHTGLKQTHLSNVVRTLSAQGFILVRPDSRDGRGRCLSVTALGRDSMNATGVAVSANSHFERNILVESSAADRYSSKFLLAPQPSILGRVA